MEEFEKPRSRTKTACETCRRKKIKCSGESPCSNCISSKDEVNCKYSERIRKSKTIEKPRNNNAKSIKIMEERLNRLEGFIVNIGEKLDYFKDDKGRSRSEISGKSPSVSNETDSDETDDESEEDDEREISEDIETNTKLTSEPAKGEIGKENKFNVEEEFVKDSGNFAIREQFFESHSFFLVCSSKSLQWINKSLKNLGKYEVVDQFRRLPYYFFSKLAALFKKFVDPIDITDQNKDSLLCHPLPNDHRFVIELINVMKDEDQNMQFICPFDQVRSLVDQYFEGKRKLNNSNLLLLCSITALSINSHLTSKKQHLRERLEILNKYRKQQYNQIFELLTTSSILLYQRVCVIPQGVETIRAILMMVTMFEASGSMKLDLNYIILSVAIRYAQEFGLHRPESYKNLTPSERKSRKQLWSLCLYYDVEFCFRNGKPPIASSLDLSQASKEDLSYILELAKLDVSAIEFFDPITKIGYLHLSSVEKLYHDKHYIAIARYSHYALSRLRFHSYFDLFTSVGNLQTVQNLEMILEDLNVASIKIVNSLVGEFKPRFYDDPDFDYYVDKTLNVEIINNDNEFSLYDELIGFQFLFFFHLMVTNRVPFLTTIINDSPKIQTFRKIFIRSTRTLLHLGLKMNHFKAFSLVWYSFYPFAAFLMLCSIVMNNPQMFELHQDMNLLSSILTMFFDLAFDDNKDPVGFNLRNNRFGFQCVIMKLFYQIVVGVVEVKTGIKFATNTRHEKQMESLKFIAPELFSNKKIIDINVQSSYNEEESLSNNSTAKDYNSPSHKPSLANIMDPNICMESHDLNRLLPGTKSSLHHHHPLNPHPHTANHHAHHHKPSPHYHEPMTSPLFNPDIVLDDQMNDFVSNQMSSLPNFFFDNNLGFS